MSHPRQARTCLRAIAHVGVHATVVARVPVHVHVHVHVHAHVHAHVPVPMCPSLAPATFEQEGKRSTEMQRGERERVASWR